MSTLYEITTFKFHNDAPSDEQIEACILNAVRNEQFAIDICWDDSTMAFDYQPARKHLQGRGWIERTNADFVAKIMNGKIKRGELIL